MSTSWEARNGSTQSACINLYPWVQPVGPRQWGGSADGASPTHAGDVPKGHADVNAPPTNGMQFFGQVDIDAKTRAMTFTLKDLQGTSLYAKTLAPQRG